MSDEYSADREETVLKSLFSFQVRRFNVLYTRASTLIYNSDFDLKLNEWRVLAAIMTYGNAALSLGRLAQEAGLDYGLASRLVGSLVQKKLVIRRPGADDARSRVLKVTSKGRRLASEVLDVACARNKNLTQDLSDEEVQMLNKVMNSLIQRAEIMLFDELEKRCKD